MTKSPSCPVPSVEDVRLARESGPILAHLATQGKELCFRFDKGKEVVLSGVAIKALADALALIAEGSCVAVTPVHREVSTTQAARLLGVSRPYLVGLLKAGGSGIAFRLVGTHHRIDLRSLLAYKKRMDADSGAALDELVAEAQELGLGY